MLAFPNHIKATSLLLDSNKVFISRTVLLETEWVLRSVYKNTRTAISHFFETALMTEKPDYGKYTGS